MTQPTPRNIGRRNTHNTNPSIAPIIPTNQRRTLFMRLRLEMDALPRLFPKSAIRAAFGKSEASFVFALIGTGFDMLLFVFIVRHFFYASIDYRSFACSLTRQRAEAKKGCSPFGLKIRAVGLEIFQPKGKRIALLRTFINPSKQHFLC